uniref:DUF5727 domain-containing protein n=1 Tax=Schistocephalus solidus TaxID=70667 RepID=A0A0X3NW91_SCHSO
MLTTSKWARMLWIALLLDFFGIKCGEAPVLWGSSVVTDSYGPSPLLRYETEFRETLILDNEGLDIFNGACYVNDIEVGRPCSVNRISAGVVFEIKLYNVTDHKELNLWEYTTLFVPDCVFPHSSTGEALPEVSLPFSKFMKGFNELNITFAALINLHSYNLVLVNNRYLICKWDNTGLRDGDKNFCQLTFRDNNREAWFYGIFPKEHNKRNTYRWYSNVKSRISVSVDWMQTGNAPEDEICSKKSKSG